MVSFLPKVLVDLRRSELRFVILLPYPGFSMLLVIPEIQESASSKGISSKFKSFSYLYDGEQFIASLRSDVIIVKNLPLGLNEARKRKGFPIFKPKRSASPDYYTKELLPMLKNTKVIGLVIMDGSCLQLILSIAALPLALLPPPPPSQGLNSCSVRLRGCSRCPSQEGGPFNTKRGCS